jgi:hypothetical protein
MPDDMTKADIGAMEFFASFSNGGFPRGYAKNVATRNYYQEAYRNMKKQAPDLKGIEFQCCNYFDLNPKVNFYVFKKIFLETKSIDIINN